MTRPLSTKTFVGRVRISLADIFGHNPSHVKDIELARIQAEKANNLRDVMADVSLDRAEKFFQILSILGMNNPIVISRTSVRRIRREINEFLILQGVVTAAELTEWSRKRFAYLIRLRYRDGNNVEG